MPKLSTKTGLIYAYTRPPDPSGSQGYYWTAIDFRTGKTVWQQYAGSGLVYNNNYAGLAIGPDGTAYLAIGGIVALRDGETAAEPVAGSCPDTRRWLSGGLREVLDQAGRVPVCQGSSGDSAS